MLFNKRGSILLTLILLLLLLILIVSNISANEHEELFTSNEDTEELFVGNEDTEVIEEFSTPAEAISSDGSQVSYVKESEDNSAYYDFSQVEQDTIITEIPEFTSIETVAGPISSFSMTNALFSLGSLIQGSFISFSNNNNIYFKSLFDASEFTATLDEEGTLEVGQKNSFGELGKVVIQIEN